MALNNCKRQNILRVNKQPDVILSRYRPYLISCATEGPRLPSGCGEHYQSVGRRATFFIGTTASCAQWKMDHNIQYRATNRNA